MIERASIFFHTQNLKFKIKKGDGEEGGGGEEEEERILTVRLEGFFCAGSKAGGSFLLWTLEASHYDRPS